MQNKVKYLFADFEKAVARLQAALESNLDDDLVVDASIQRFEFTFELAWKLMQAYLKYLGIICKSPRESIKAAYQQDLLDNGDAWIDMLVDRNKTSHIYDETEATKIYDKIRTKHFSQLKLFVSKIKGVLKVDNAC